MNMKKTTLAVMIGACFSAQTAQAQEETKTLSPVVVTATRVEQDSFDVPVSIDRIEKATIQDGQLRMTLSESLSRVPGITAQNRNQMAQDPQISSRGFGARSAFGVRGIRLYVDGIPLSMPDGIGNPGSIDLSSIGAIEVLRGPFSAMYGSSSGGVIQLFTDTPPATPEVSGDVLFGSFNTRRESVQAAGIRNGVEYLVNFSDYSSDGFRTQSKNDKQQATVRLGVNISEDTKLTTLINWFDQFAQDPGGLIGVRSAGTSPATANNPGALPGAAVYNPSGTSIGAKLANTRVIRSNTQVGFNLEHKYDASNTFNLITYAGQRDNLQYLSVPNLSVPNSPDFTPGRASSISRTFFGTELRGTNKGTLYAKPFTLTYGINLGFMSDDRLDRPTTSGVINGQAANRDENQTANNFDQYVQGMWSVAERWDLHAGLRRTRLDLKIRPNITGSTSPTAADLSFEKTVPVLGAVFKASPVLNFYANLGRGFETPTLIELTYADPNNAAAGPNGSLRPSTSTNIEIGSKWLLSDTSRINAAIFDISTNNEIVIDQLNGTTASYKNAGKTKRRGFELSAETMLRNDLSAYVAYTYLDASFQSQFATGTGASNAGAYNAGTVTSGLAIPGTYRTQFYGELLWKYQPWALQTAIEGRYNSRVYVNDLNKESAPSFAVFSLRGSLQQQVGKWKITEYARIDNLFDEAYIGSVRIGDSNTRFYEPAPGRNWIVGVKANYAF
jgi:iron complex outermembrane receptor protein